MMNSAMPRLSVLVAVSSRETDAAQHPEKKPTLVRAFLQLLVLARLFDQLEYLHGEERC